MSDTVIRVEHVSKKFCKTLKRSMLYGLRDIGVNLLGRPSDPARLRPQEFWALDDVSFEVKAGETLGLIGPNGSGKTTLLKMLNGIFWPDKGRIAVTGRVGALIAVGAGFHQMLTGRENIYVNAAILGMSKKEVDKKFDAIVDFADIGDFLDSPVKHYSSGMFVRLGFAVAVHCEPDVLLVDEVLAVGDTGFQAKCLDKISEIKRNGASIVLVSHNMHSISVISDAVVLIRSGKAHFFRDVGEGVAEYNRIFEKRRPMEIVRHTSGNGTVRFVEARVVNQYLRPGEDFEIVLDYEADQTCDDVLVDVALTSSKAQGQVFQATNRVFDRSVVLEKGRGDLTVRLKSLNFAHDHLQLDLTIARGQNSERLLWWTIPLKFAGILVTNGHLFYEMEVF